MKRVPSSPPAAELRPWRVALIRKKLERLGRVYATDMSTAEDAAVAEFRLNDYQRERLLIEAVA